MQKNLGKTRSPRFSLLGFSVFNSFSLPAENNIIFREVHLQKGGVGDSNGSVVVQISYGKLLLGQIIYFGGMKLDGSYVVDVDAAI